MTRLARVCGIVCVWVLTALALQPCEISVYAQTREEQIFCETQAANPCEYPECAYLDACPDLPIYVGDSEPTCCGTGVDCRCDWYGGDPAFLDGGDRYCTGWSYCCGHDQCCRDGGWLFCVTVCWVASFAYC